MDFTEDQPEELDEELKAKLSEVAKRQVESVIETAGVAPTSNLQIDLSMFRNYLMTEIEAFRSYQIFDLFKQGGTPPPAVGTVSNALVYIAIFLAGSKFYDIAKDVERFMAENPTALNAEYFDFFSKIQAWLPQCYHPKTV